MPQRAHADQTNSGAKRCGERPNGEMHHKERIPMMLRKNIPNKRDPDIRVPYRE